MASSGAGSVPGQLSGAFASGVVGAVVALIVAWVAGRSGLFSDLGCHWQPMPSRGAGYSLVVWGGIFGLIFCLPLMAGSVVKRGLVFGLVPALVQLLIVLPLLDHQQVLGFNHGYTTPFFVVVLDSIWGLTAAGWLKMIGG